MDKFRQAWISPNHKASHHFERWGHAFRWQCIMKLIPNGRWFANLRRHSKMGFKPQWGKKA